MMWLRSAAMADRQVRFGCLLICKTRVDGIRLRVQLVWQANSWTARFLPCSVVGTTSSKAPRTAIGGLSVRAEQRPIAHTSAIFRRAEGCSGQTRLGSGAAHLGIWGLEKHGTVGHLLADKLKGRGPDRGCAL